MYMHMYTSDLDDLRYYNDIVWGSFGTKSIFRIDSETGFLSQQKLIINYGWLKSSYM